jgi:hypothetical protein
VFTPLTVAMSLLLSATTFYPGLGDRGVVLPKTIETHPRVEATRDLGPILELIVRCNSGSAIVSYSKVERVYCRPKGGCLPDLNTTLATACRGQ